MIIATSRVFTRLLRILKINTVCDVGSLDGADARRFRRALPDARIIAFEPHPDNFRGMQADRALAQANITLAPLAVTDHDGTAELFAVGAGYAPGESWRAMSSLHRRVSQPELLAAVPVQATRLDSYLAGHRGPDLRLALWIDAEGKSYEVIEGAAALLPHTQLLHVEVETRPCIGATQRFYPEVQALLRSAGFVEVATDGTTGQVQFNALFLRADLPLIMGYRTRLALVHALLRRAVGKRLVSISPGFAAWLNDHSATP